MNKTGQVSSLIKEMAPSKNALRKRLARQNQTEEEKQLEKQKARERMRIKRYLSYLFMCNSIAETPLELLQVVKLKYMVFSI